ncbi:MAG: hypothetical protein AAB552_03740 [Patescibacteria group bacterium]
MKIVIATPLYPPDIEPTALYCKEFARRLAGAGHSVVVATYGNIPEDVPGVTVTTTDKRQFLLVRIILYTMSLWKSIKDANVIYVQNGASVEFPLFILSFVAKKPIVLLSTDTNATERAEKNLFLKKLRQAIEHRAHLIIKKLPPQKPEILPFVPQPTHALTEYETAWQQHIQQLTHITP